MTEPSALRVSVTGVAAVGGHRLVHATLLLPEVVEESRAVQVAMGASVEGHWLVAVLTPGVIVGYPLLQTTARVAAQAPDGRGVAVDPDVAAAVKGLAEVRVLVPPWALRISGVADVRAGVAAQVAVLGYVTQAWALPHPVTVGCHVAVLTPRAGPRSLHSLARLAAALAVPEVVTVVGLQLLAPPGVVAVFAAHSGSVFQASASEAAFTAGVLVSITQVAAVMVNGRLARYAVNLNADASIWTFTVVGQVLGPALPLAGGVQGEVLATSKPAAAAAAAAVASVAGDVGA